MKEINVVLYEHKNLIFVYFDETQLTTEELFKLKNELIEASIVDNDCSEDLFKEFFDEISWLDIGELRREITEKLLKLNYKIIWE